MSSQNDTIGYEEVLGRSPRAAEIRENLSEIPLKAALERLQRIGSILYFGELKGILNRDPRAQLACLRELRLGADPLDGMVSRLLTSAREYPPVVFYREQISLATAYAVSFCNARATATGHPKDGVLLLRALLAINTYLTRNTFGNDPLVLRRAVSGEITRNQIIQGLMQRDVSYFVFAREPWYSGITRYFTFMSWLGGATSFSNLDAAPYAYDLRKTFKEVFSIEFETFLGVGLYMLDGFQRQALSLADLADAVGETSADAFLRLTAMSLSEVRRDFRVESTDDCSPPALARLAMKPLIVLDDGRVILVDWALLGNVLGRGWFLTLRTLRDASVLSDAYGKFLERYSFAILKNAAGGSIVLPEQLYNRDQEKSSDSVAFLGNRAVFFEVVGKRLNFSKSVIARDITAIQDDIAKMCVMKAKQLDRNIKDFRTGKLRFEGIDPAQVRDVFPVIITADPLPRQAIEIFVAEELQRQGLLQTSHRLEIIEIGLLEGLNDTVGVPALIDVLNEKSRSKDRRPFKEFIGSTAFSTKLRNGPQIRAEQQRMRVRLLSTCPDAIAQAVDRLIPIKA